MPGSEKKKARDRERMRVKRATDQATIIMLRDALSPFARASDVLNISYRVTEQNLLAAKAAIELSEPYAAPSQAKLKINPHPNVVEIGE